MARFAAEMNKNHENMGARRLQAIVEKVMEDISFESIIHKGSTIIIDREYVTNKCKGWDEKLMLVKYLI